MQISDWSRHLRLQVILVEYRISLLVYIEHLASESLVLMLARKPWFWKLIRCALIQSRLILSYRGQACFQFQLRSVESQSSLTSNFQTNYFLFTVSELIKRIRVFVTNIVNLILQHEKLRIIKAIRICICHSLHSSKDLSARQVCHAESLLLFHISCS